MSAASNKTIFQRMVTDVLEGKNRAAAAELFAPGAALHTPLAPSLAKGPAGATALAEIFARAFPDLAIQIDRLHASEDRVAGRLIESGTHQGPFLSVPASGKPVDFTQISVLRIENGKIAEAWFELDSLRIAQQIGALSSPG